MQKNFVSFSAIDWQRHLENLPQQEIQLGLERITKVAKKLDLQKTTAIVICIAGTNGKGSTVAALEAFYVAAGYKVGSYTSPHLLYFNERIKLNQQPIHDIELAQAFLAIEQVRDEIVLTYFEMTTLAALWFFKKYHAQLLLLEVGLGGRLDATNIIDADLSIITSIDLDHQEFLGHDRETIGYEKAGILRANKPFVYADFNPPTSVLSKARQLNCPGYLIGEQYHYQLTAEEFIFSQQLPNLQCPQVYLPRTALHPNAIAAAIMSCLIMQNLLPINVTSFVSGINNVSLLGRLQLIKGKIFRLFDVAHNPQATRYLANYIKTLSYSGVVHGVFAALKDKDLQGLISPLIDIVTHWYPAFLPVKRAALKEQYDKVFYNMNLAPLYYANPVMAYNSACSLTSDNDLIVVYGSFITVGDILNSLCT